MTEPRQDTVEKVAEAIAVALTNGDEDYWASHECHLECARAAINAMSDVREKLELIEHDATGIGAPGARLQRIADYARAALESLSGGGK